MSQSGNLAAQGPRVGRLMVRANKAQKRALETAERAIEYAVGSGRALEEIQSLCEPGEWQPYIERAFDGSLRTAQKYMRISRHLGRA